MNNHLTISCIVPIHSGQVHATKSLNSILRAEPLPEKVILVSDGPCVEINDLIDPSRIVRLQLSLSAGPAAARNFGAASAETDLLCFIDSDIVVPKELFARIVEKFQLDSDVDALFGSYDSDPGHINFLSQYRNLLHHFVHQTSHETASTFWSGCGAIRRQVFNKVGGFDADQFQKPSIEDIELGYRLIKSGHSIKLYKDLQVKHLKEWSPFNMLKVDLFDRGIPWSKLLLKQGKISNDLNLKLSNRISVVLSGLVAISCISTIWNFGAVFFFIPFFGLFIKLNFSLYSFFYKLKGLRFTIRVIPWHLLFYIVSGLAFVWGIVEFLISKYQYEFRRE